MDEKGQREFGTIDIWLSSFLKLHGLSPELRLHKGKVLFVFPGDDTTYRLIAEFNTNTELVDYIGEVKILKSAMFSLKATGAGE